jgi:hypothetical protein
VTETTSSQAAEHGTLKLIIGGSDSHSPCVACCCVSCGLLALVEVARFGTHVGLEAWFRWKLGPGGIT